MDVEWLITAVTDEECVHLLIMTESFDEKLIQLQENPSVFIAECFLCFYILMSQGVMCDLFLMPAILNTSQRWGFSKTISAVLLALGVTVPELIVTMLSFHRHGVKMTEFGLAVVFGGIAFALSAIPVVAYTFNFGCRKKRPAQPTDLLFTLENKRFRNSLIRDLTTILISMAAYYWALENGTISY